MNSKSMFNPHCFSYRKHPLFMLGALKKCFPWPKATEDRLFFAIICSAFHALCSLIYLSSVPSPMP